MTRNEIINEINCLLFELDNGDDAVSYLTQNDVNWLKENIKALEQEPYEDCVSRKAVDRLAWEYLRKSTDENVAFYERFLELPPVTPQEPFINKPCVSSEVCEHDKQKVLDKIRAEIEQNAYPIVHGVNNHELGMTLYGILQIIDKYKAESEKA